MTMAETLPPVHSYLHDGKRLVRVEGYTDKGHMMIEDQATGVESVVAPDHIASWTPVGRD